MVWVLGYDADGIEARIIPRPCGGCAAPLKSVYLHLSPVLTDDGALSGIESVARSFACCGHEITARFSAEVLAAAIEHVNTCPRHGDPATTYQTWICHHPQATTERHLDHWIASCPDCGGYALSYFAPPVISPRLVNRRP
ncbi:hypothetical protein ACFZAM_31550 [Streptomyces sp. NPDC008079]|uniref:hypothetical protein n=1 Tax=Streptomyces sp. NPDC008079 TaxID=3364806 RepID=UPI0036EAD47E